MFAVIGRDITMPVPADVLRRGHGEVRVGQAGPARRHGHRRPVGRVRRLDVQRLPRRRRRRRRRARASSCPGGAAFSRKQLDTLAEQAKALGAGGLVWARRSGEAVQSSALKAAGEAHDRARRWTQAGAGAADLLLMACGPGRRHVEGARAAAPRRSPEAPGLAQDRRVRLHLGHRFPAARVGRGRAAVGGHAPPVHVARRGGHGPARGRPRRRARAGLRPRAERQRDRRRQHPYPRHRAAAADVPRCSASATRTRSCASASSSRRSSTARRRTAASRSASTASSRSWRASRRSATSSRSRRRRRRWT